MNAIKNQKSSKISQKKWASWSEKVRAGTGFTILVILLGIFSLLHIPSALFFCQFLAFGEISKLDISQFSAFSFTAFIFIVVVIEMRVTMLFLQMRAISDARMRAFLWIGCCSPCLVIILSWWAEYFQLRWLAFYLNVIYISIVVAYITFMLVCIFRYSRSKFYQEVVAYYIPYVFMPILLSIPLVLSPDELLSSHAIKNFFVENVLSINNIDWYWPGFLLPVWCLDSICQYKITKRVARKLLCPMYALLLSMIVAIVLIEYFGFSSYAYVMSAIYLCTVGICIFVLIWFFKKNLDSRQGG